MNKIRLKIVTKRYAFLFSDSESLTKAILFLLKIPKTEFCRSSLYKLEQKYILLTENLSCDVTDSLHEFCLIKTKNPLIIEYIKEYGKPLIINNAIKRYGVAFSKN